IQTLELIRRVLFPGYFDETRLTTETIHYHVGDLLTRVHDLLYEQVRQALRYEENRTAGSGRGDACDSCDHEARRVTHEFLARLPELRRMLALDVQAAFDGDPAASSTDETIFCYPGIDAIFIYRVAHELWNLKVPLLPRIMTEYAHNETGVDIHPGATIGESFFIDHGTGVVIGETSEIGNRVKIYQGVTLGAISTKGGQDWRGRKRHPTIEDDVTIYSGANILGGATVIGKGATIGGSVFLTASVPPGHTVTMKPPELKISAKGNRKGGATDVILDFDI
ncbi:MAG: serine acetyltransferase, partial [Planctomycetota bacterium]|nr:serine acetyltransferase [Planctomycetota bacterium]